MSKNYSFYDLTGDDDGLSDDKELPFRFLDLPLEVQSQAVDYLDLISITHLKATCQSLRALPSLKQERSALIEFEDELEEAWTLFEELDENTPWRGETKRRGIMQDVRRWQQRPPAWDDAYSGYEYGQTSKSDGSFAKWMDLASTDYYIDPFHAKWAAIGSLDKFHCYGCFRVKQSDGFDVTQFGNEYWEYRRHSYQKLPQADDFLLTASGLANGRLCVNCRLNTEDALLKGIGWLKSIWDDYYIRCSRCLQYDEIKKVFRYQYVDSGSYQEEIRGYEDMTICHRMLQGNLCQACFKEDNSEWFAFREQLRVEIEAKTKYLDWMVSKDDELSDRAPPLEDVLPYWQ